MHCEVHNKLFSFTTRPYVFQWWWMVYRFYVQTQWLISFIIIVIIPTTFNTVPLNKTLLWHPRFGVYTGVILSVNLITYVVFVLVYVSVCSDSFSLYYYLHFLCLCTSRFCCTFVCCCFVTCSFVFLFITCPFLRILTAAIPRHNVTLTCVVRYFTLCAPQTQYIKPSA